MHDNARPHVARICQQFRNRNNVNILPWLVVSPDMNPIEHIWDYLGRKVRARRNMHNLRDLENALIQEWNILRTKSVTKKEMNKCMAEIYDPGGIRTRAARLISQYHNH